MVIAVRVIALFICVVGVIGIAVPDVLVRNAEMLQVPAVIYVTAVARIVIGLVFVRAATGSRAPTALRTLGYFIIVAGLVTPFVGVWGAQLVLNWWTSGGPSVVRACGGVAIALGLGILYAAAPARHEA